VQTEKEHSAIADTKDVGLRRRKRTDNTMRAFAATPRPVTVARMLRAPFSGCGYLVELCVVNSLGVEVAVCGLEGIHLADRCTLTKLE
jgi:hypothetical protein